MARAEAAASLDGNPLLGWRTALFYGASVGALFLAPEFALLLGVFLALSAGSLLPSRWKGLAKRTLALAVVGLGAGMDLHIIARQGLRGMVLTATTISVTLLVGWWLGRRLAVPGRTSLLITVGTAICGGSAIAAVAPVARGREDEIAVALGVVFLLNAAALFLFPPLGHLSGMSQHSFGMWCALAIHDTSSVVGAAARYGHEAMAVATTTKLARALWIVPLTLAIARFRMQSSGDKEGPIGRPAFPWFIGGFLALALLFAAFPALHSYVPGVTALSRHLLALTLFLVGLGFSRDAMRRVGLRPLLQGLLLWAVVAAGSWVIVVGTGV